MRAGLPSPCTHPGELAIDMSAHRLACILDVAGDGLFTVQAKAMGICNERRKRRLQSVGEIGRTTTRALDLALLGVEQRIDLGDQRLDLVGRRHRQAGATPGANVGDVAA